MKTTQQVTRITFIGHATLLIELNGVRILTDPLLRNWVWHLHRQQVKIDERWYQNIDAILLSHMHGDHLDLPSLRLVGKNTRLIVPRGVAPLLQKKGFTQLEELSAGEHSTVGNLPIKATQALHDGARFRFGPKADTLGYVLEGNHTIYFAGDTDLFPEMAALAENLDVALLPVWGWGPTLGTGHLDPYRAALALQLLAPRLAIPIHWGTFFPVGLGWMLPRFLSDPPHTFAKFAAKLAPEAKVHIISPGVSINLDEQLEK